MSHVDTSSPITHVSLCAGYGGIDLGLRRAIPALRTIAVSEIESFACANLVAKMEAGLLDPAPIWTDLKTFPWAEFRDRVDILSGGYPCQPFSAAGKRLGAEDPRHLWPHISAGIAVMRPSVCFFENVEGHISLGLPDVIEDLAGLGYRTTWGIFSASEVGAPHQRKRVFILAYRHGERGQLPDWWREPAEQVLVGYGETRRDDAMANAQLHGRDHANARPHADGIQGPLGQGHEHRQALGDGQLWPSRPGEQQFAWEPPRVVADSKKSGRTDQRVAGELDCETGSQGGRGHQSAPAAADCGDAGIVSDSKSMRLEEQSQCGQQPEADGERTSNAGRVRPCETQEGRPVEHTSDRSIGEQPTEQQGRHSVGGSGEEGAMGNAAHTNRRSRVSAEEAGAGPEDIWRRRSGESGERQTQPPLGRDADGPADWLDDAELFTTCDNRTDELRLLGNGVVPATAERAFRVLVGELMEHQP